MSTRLLIATIGGSPEPIVASLLKWRPARVLFVVSNETISAVPAQLTPAVQSAGWADFDAGRYDLVKIANAQDYAGIVTELRVLDARIQGWLHDYPASEVIADFTGGTKAMTAAIALTAARWPCQISYVGGTERTKDGVGVVVSGKEQIVHAQNPWDALGYLAADEAATLFNHGDFSAAAQVLESTRNRMAEASRKKEFQAFIALCQVFECWERFQHKDALRKLCDVRRDKNDLCALLGSHRADSILGWLASAEANLQPLASGQTDSDSLLSFVHDLLANASRRIREGRYDDAVARLYRAIEAYAQSILHAHGFPNTANVPLEKLPEPLGAEWQSRAENGAMKLGLQDDYRLLAALSDEAATRFTQLKLDDTKASLLVARNNSILAHGYAPVRKETAEKLFAATLQLAGLKQSDLTFFPTLKH